MPDDLGRVVGLDGLLVGLPDGAVPQVAELLVGVRAVEPRLARHDDAIRVPSRVVQGLAQVLLEMIEQRARVGGRGPDIRRRRPHRAGAADPPGGACLDSHASQHPPAPGSPELDQGERAGPPAERLLGMTAEHVGGPHRPLHRRRRAGLEPLHDVADAGQDDDGVQAAVPRQDALEDRDQLRRTHP